MKKIKLFTSCLLLVLGLSACAANKDAATKKSDTSAAAASQGETGPGATKQGETAQGDTAQGDATQDEAGQGENAAQNGTPESSAAEEALKMTQADIYLEEITDFYYTAANTENSSGYLRYRFYVKDGSYFFSFDKRDANGNYAATEGESGSGAGNVSLGTEERLAFFKLIQNGNVKARDESSENGGSGPWMYLYTEKYPDGLVFHFASATEQTAFEEYCAELAARETQP
jgi:lipoprotein